MCVENNIINNIFDIILKDHIEKWKIPDAGRIFVQLHNDPWKNEPEYGGKSWKES